MIEEKIAATKVLDAWKEFAADALKLLNYRINVLAEKAGVEFDIDESRELKETISALKQPVYYKPGVFYDNAN